MSQPDRRPPSPEPARTPADERPDAAPRDEPLKRHGDALRTGTGSRHGADADLRDEEAQRDAG